jgi:hypothetical protein
MLESEIKNRATLRNVQKYEIDVSSFKNIDELRTYIKKMFYKSYRDEHKEYYRDYMRERYSPNEYQNKKLFKELPVNI